jgi:hypothetical protein
MLEDSLEMNPKRIKKPNKSRHATPISRPVFMLSRRFNTNPVIEVRSR